MPKLVYELHVHIPEIGGRPGDVVIIEPGRPVHIVRKLRGDTLEVVAVLERYSAGIGLMLCSGGPPPASSLHLRRWLRAHMGRAMMMVD